MKKSLFLSFFIHMFLLLALVGAKGCAGGTGKGNKEQKKDGDDKSSELLPNGQKATPEDNTIAISLISKPRKKALPECPGGRTYGGIGITEDMDGYITSAPEYYPAYQAGIRVGDRLVNENEVRGDPGTVVLVLTMRKEQQINYTIVREKICFKERKYQQP